MTVLFRCFLSRSHVRCFRKIVRYPLVPYIGQDSRTFILSSRNCSGDGGIRLHGSNLLGTENSFSHSLLASNALYKKTILQLPEYIKSVEENQNSGIDKELNTIQWQEMTIDKFCSVFESVSCEMGYHRKMSIADNCFDEMCNAMSTRCKDMDDEQLALALRSLTLWRFCDNQKTNNFYSIWKGIDNECISRFRFWDVSKIFYFVDLWYSLHLLRQSDFVYTTMTKYTKRPSKLSPQELVQLLFYLNALRTLTKRLTMYEIEYELEKCIEQLSLEEIAVASMGFFKTENFINSEKIVSHIIERIIQEIKSINEISLTCLLKILRYSSHIPLWPRIPEMLDAICSELDRLSVTCAVHAAHTTTRPQMIHENMFQKMSRKLIDNISTARMKDMEKGIFSMVHVGFDPSTKPCIYETVVQELSRLERAEEISRYPKTFVAIVHYLCLKQIFVQKFIEKVLDMSFIRKTYGDQKYAFGREILFIDSVVELEYPSYNGTRLPTDIRNYLSKRYSSFLPDPSRKLSKHLQWHLEIIRTAESLFGKDFVTCKYLLPNHPRADIIVHLDESGNPLPLPKSITETEDFTGPIKAPADGLCAIIVGSKNMFLFDSVIPNGETNSKLRQLKLLGFRPVMVNSMDWPKSSTLEKLQHLRNLVLSQ